VTLQFAPLPDATGDHPSVFTALEEDLGLKGETDATGC